MIEHYGNPYVLPSNAPPLPSAPPFVLDPSAPPFVLDRALQERSANRQDEFVKNGNVLSHKKHSSVLQTDRPLPSSHTPISRTNRPRFSSHDSSFPPRATYYDPQRRTEKDKVKEQQNLFRELQHSKLYLTYREHQPPKDKQVWPDHVERAFMKAIVEYPPMGRKQLYVKGKKCGRNECISAYIENVTGVKRKRKQVSSHNQTLVFKLKENLQENWRILRYFPQPKEATTGLPSQSGNMVARSDSDSIPDSILRTPSLQSAESELAFCQSTIAAVTPFEFDMSSEQLSDCNLDETGPTLQWENMFPQLAQEYNAGRLSCPVIYAEASLQLMMQAIPEAAQLGIRFEFTGAQNVDVGAYAWDCRTGFYDNGIRVDQSIGRIAYDVEVSRRLHTVPFGSNFWARKFVDLARPIREIRKAQEATVSQQHDQDVFPSRPKDVLRNTEEHVRQKIRELSAVQEISATPLEGGATERVLIIYWKFKQTVRGENEGRMQWRNLILPTRPPVAVAAAEFNHLSLDFGTGPLMDTGPQPYAADVTTPFEFDAPLILAGLSSSEVVHQPIQSLQAVDNVSQDNSIDFDGGQINICLGASVPMEPYDPSLTSDSQYSVDAAMQQQQFAEQWAGYSAMFETPVTECYGEHGYITSQMEHQGHGNFYQYVYPQSHVAELLPPVLEGHLGSN